jgi:hypothetical protein
MMIIGTVVEGPTDALVLITVIGRLYPGRHRYLDLQPSNTYVERGNGWKGVRAWCKETWQRRGSSLETLLSAETGDPMDLLVIVVDADIANEADLQDDGLGEPVAEVARPCPPIAATVAQLERVILRWLQRDGDALPPQVLIAIPAQDMENWTFAALFSEDRLCKDEGYECYHSGASRDRHPGYRLTLRRYGKLLKRDGTTIKKSQAQYRRLLPKIAENWPRVCEICTQAQRFEKGLRARLD